MVPVGEGVDAAAEAACRRRLRMFVLKKKMRMAPSERASAALGVAVRNESHKMRRLERLVREGAAPGLDCFEAKQEQWDDSVDTELRAMARELQLPVTGGRAAPTAPSRNAAPLKFLYDSEDLLLALSAVGAELRVPEVPGASAQSASAWRKAAVGLSSFSRAELAERFRELHPRFPQVGVDDQRGDFLREHEALGARLVKMGSVPLMERFLRQGSTAALRPRLYTGVLRDHWAASVKVPAARQGPRGPLDHAGPGALPPADHAAGLEVCPVADADSVVNRLHALDLELIRNNDQYFVFEDMLSGVLPALFRDHAEWLELHSRVTSRSERARAVPYHGFALMAAPLAFVFRDEREITLCLREMVARYWCQLNVLRNSRPGDGLTLLPNLCAQFESLVLEACPRAVHHMLSLGLAPLDVAFEWIHLAFASVLPAEQVLRVWDRIIGFDSLLVLPMVAAAIFDYRAEALLRTQSAGQARELLRETAKLNVVALLQAFLFF